MVQAIENRSLVWCTPTSAPLQGPAPGWCTVVVLVERTSPAHDLPDLMAEAAGDEYTALVPGDLAASLSDRSAWVVEAEVTGPRRLTVRSVADEDAVAD